MHFRASLVLFGALALIGSAQAQEPAGYYASVDPTNATTLRATLHAVIDDHTKISYTAGSTDTWDVLALASEDPQNAANIIDVYKNDSLPKQTGGNSFYDREHTWPNSYGFPNDGASNYPYTDCHMLFLSVQAYNSARGNAPYRNCSASCTERVTTLTNGSGGGSGLYPGNSNWNNGSSTTDTWETWIGKRGDVARALLYADVRYEGGTHGVTGQPEPDLIVTDSQSLIAGSATGSNLSVAYMGIKSVLVQWSQQDPPDAWERRRNDIVMSFQGNRNPFIDHPEWVNCLFGTGCPPGVSFCYGDGSGTGCPCGNVSVYGDRSGCLNSSGSGGALSATGTASVSNDTLVLLGSGMTNSFVLYFQGTSAQNGGNGTVFGDGKTCAGGAIIRLGLSLNVAGASQFPGGGQPLISVQGATAAGNVRHYQGWYRDAAVFCSSATFNLTSGYRVVWTP
ncbi:MAG: endonuclease [Planctomycetes bacterium]|nr:endonuclease [Planctomycetota bacterium]